MEKRRMEMEEKQGKILIVDDEESVQRILMRIVKKIERECTTTSSAEEARQIMKKKVFDLILCDIKLPGESGIDFIKHVASRYPETAIIMVSGVEDTEVAETAIEIGAYGYIIKPFKPSQLIITISNALRRQKLETESRLYREDLEKLVAARTEKLQETIDGVIQVVAHTVEARDPYTAGHQKRVADLACAIAEYMQFSDDQITGLRMAGVIHDLGKISIPAEILSKPSRLSEPEFNLLKTHPQVGFNILKGISFPLPVAEIVFQHHERMDGSGYPRGLKGSDILAEARILSVADVVEAMSSHRPYRAALGIDAALDEIVRNKGIIYDSDAVDACLKVIREEQYRFDG